MAAMKSISLNDQMKPRAPKRKNSEKRKEKSKIAARLRRGHESEIFHEMGELLPLPPLTVAHMDKTSIIRLTVSYLRTRELADQLPELLQLRGPLREMKSESGLTMISEAQLLMDALDGFFVMMSHHGELIYVSENVEEYLGLAQTELMGNNIFDLSHPCDQTEIKELLSLKLITNGPSSSNGVIHSSKANLDLPEPSHENSLQQHPCCFFIRMKCTLTSKGRSVNLKSATYKAIHFTGYLITNNHSDSKADSAKTSAMGPNAIDSSSSSSSFTLALVGSPIPNPSDSQTTLPSDAFVTKHSLDMKITFVDESICKFIDYESQDLIGKSLYDYLHAMDLMSLEDCFKSLFIKGQTETGYYRFLAKHGGYIWLSTQASLINDTANHCQPTSVICIHNVLSGVEGRNQVLCEEQLKKPVTSSPISSVPISTPPLLSDSSVFGESRSVTASCFKSISVSDQRKSADVINFPQQSTKKSKQQPDQEQESRDQYQELVDQVSLEDLLDQVAGVEVESFDSRDTDKENNSPLNCGTNNADGGSDKFLNSGCNSGDELTDDLIFPVAPLPATEKIFAPRTADMNSGFLMLHDEQGLTILPDTEIDSEDLTHLAPQAGDACIPLNVPELQMDGLWPDFTLDLDSFPNLDEKCMPFTMVDDDINSISAEEINEIANGGPSPSSSQSSSPITSSNKSPLSFSSTSQCFSSSPSSNDLPMDTNDDFCTDNSNEIAILGSKDDPLNLQDLGIISPSTSKVFTPVSSTVKNSNLKSDPFLFYKGTKAFSSLPSTHDPPDAPGILGSKDPLLYSDHGLVSASSKLSNPASSTVRDKNLNSDPFLFYKGTKGFSSSPPTSRELMDTLEDFCTENAILGSKDDPLGFLNDLGIPSPSSSKNLTPSSSPPTNGSVLFNLLVSGEDATNGYSIQTK